MPGTQEAEMAVIERCQLGFVEAFDDGEDGGVDKADVRVGTPITEVSDARVILGHQVVDEVGAHADVIEQRKENTGMHSSKH